MTKRLRAPKAKPGELKMQWGKLPGDYPDMCFAWGDGCSNRDGNFLHYVLASARPTMNRDDYGNPVFDKSVLEQLNERGYDLTTLRFSIMKKPANDAREGRADRPSALMDGLERRIGCIGHDGECCKDREQERLDAARYRWLRSQRDLGPHGTKGLPWVVWVRPDESIPTLGPLFSGDCDAAIDAALRSNK